MKDLLKVDGGYINKENIVRVKERLNRNKTVACIEVFSVSGNLPHSNFMTFFDYISDGRTLEDVMVELEGKEETCKWMRATEKQIGNPHIHAGYKYIDDLKQYPYCSCCGKRIEVTK